MTAIFFLPIYWLKKFKYTKKILIIVISAVVLGHVLKFILLGFFNKFTRMIYDPSDAGGQMMYGFYIVITCFSLFFSKYFTGRFEENKIYVYMMMITVAIWPLCSMNPNLFRLTFYYTIFLSLYVSNFITALRPRDIAVVTTILMLIGGLLVFEKINKNPVALKYPYYFYWEK
jgi:hypothetical protein